MFNEELFDKKFILFQFVSHSIESHLSCFAYSSMHEKSIQINQPLIPFPVFNMAYEKVVSPLFENNSGALDIVQFQVIIPKVFFDQLKTVSHLYFGAPKEILTHYSCLLLSELGFT